MSETRPRVGHIQFLNCLPLDYALMEGGFAAGLDVVCDVPAVLNGKLLAGELDVSPVSSIVYAQHADKLLLLPNLSISAETALESILLVSKKPLEKLEGGKVLLTSKSATSHRQLKVVLAQQYGLHQVRYETTASLWSEGILDEADAVLFIGDDALGAYLHQQEGYYYYDMGGQWRELTGGGMVYAVWVARREFAAAQPQALQQVQQRLRDAFTYGLEHLEEAAAWIRRDGFTPAEIVHYIGLLNYDMTPKHQQALLGFYQRAHALDLIEQVPQLVFAGESQA
nr:menaquinone biosynthesis protein [uncultured Anaeromusa sp.]